MVEGVSKQVQNTTVEFGHILRGTGGNTTPVRGASTELFPFN
jgi:hypothetical protein